MFDWDEGNLGHIAEHGIGTHEAEEALLDARRVPAPAYQVASERRRAVLGATPEGRLLFVVFMHRGGAIRVITARDATAASDAVTAGGGHDHEKEETTRYRQ
ncbi:MAG TPA: BrnT family toxin [Chloroflexota bacterium]|nr:BrnT family toxin [Chloroflexota bacterium]